LRTNSATAQHCQSGHGVRDTGTKRGKPLDEGGKPAPYRQRRGNFRWTEYSRSVAPRNHPSANPTIGNQRKYRAAHQQVKSRPRIRKCSGSAPSRSNFIRQIAHGDLRTDPVERPAKR